MDDQDFIEDIAERIIAQCSPGHILGSWIFVPKHDEADGYPALVYNGNYFIHFYDHEYSLLIGNMEITSQCLSELEWHLAKYKLLEEGLEPWLHL